MPAPPLVRTRALFPALGGLNVVLFITYAGVQSVLLPTQVESIDPEGKVASLAIVTSTSAAFTLFAQPLIGALSDRTRSRLGRRAPWMIGTSVIAGGILLGMGGAETVAALAVFWTLTQFALNGVDIASSAIIVDRVPRERRGVASSMLAAGAMAGGALGATVVGPFAGEPRLGYAMLGVAIIAAVAAFVVVAREPSSRDLEPPRATWRDFLRGFWVDPRRHPDFVWILAARIAFTTGFAVVYGYLLYIATDHLGLGSAEATRLVGLVTLVGGATMVLAILVGGWLSDRTGRRRDYVVVAGISLVVALLVPLVWPSAQGLVVFAALQGIGSGLSLVCGIALASEVLPDSREAGRGFGIYNVASALPQIIAPPIAATVITLIGYTGLFVVALVCAVAATFLASRIRGTG